MNELSAVSSTSLEPLLPAHVAAAEPPRRRLLLTATAFLSAGVIMLFVGLLSIYASVRDSTLTADEDWLNDRIIPLTPGNLVTGSLALAAVSVWWIVHATKTGDRYNAYVAIAISMVLGVASINALAFQLSESGLTVRGSQPGMLVFVITGAFIATLVAALLFLVVLGFRLLGSTDTTQQLEVASSAAMFWYAMTAVYSVIWWAVYVTK